MSATRRKTSYDVAQLAGVSQSAVSRAFSEDGSVSQKMRDKIRAAADELGYRPNAIARSLGKGQSGLIGMIINRHSQQSYAAALTGITEILRESGGGVLLQVVDADSLADEAIATLLDYQVDAIICSSVLSNTAAEQCAKSGVALCLVNRQTDSMLVDEVFSDNEGVSFAIALGLASTGVQNAAYIYGPESGFVSRLRFQGFSAGCVQAGLAKPSKIYCDFTYQGGYDAALELLDLNPNLDAIFAATDTMAFGVMDALRYSKGIAVPDTIQVVGFDDEATAAYRAYQLTSVRQPMAVMLLEAVDLARDRIKNPKSPKRRVETKSKVIQRKTATWTIQSAIDSGRNQN